MSLSARKPLLSIIIPTLNEADHIDRILGQASRGEGVEIIVVDGGSTDATRERAAAHGVRLSGSPVGRARQMNQGAALARGEIYFFLHADSRLPRGYDGVIRRTLEDDDVAAGAFSLGIEADTPGLRFIESWANLRSRWLDLPYGDQGLFLKAARFRACGGFPDLPIMEDVVMIGRLRRTGRIRTVPECLYTSPRRWQRLGVLRTTFVNQAVLTGFLLGVAPGRLARWYRRWPED